jgi:hypothetical protein
LVGFHLKRVYIQEKVRVDFDNAEQAPVHFKHVVKFQELLDRRVLKLLSFRPEDLSDVVDAGKTLHSMETPAAYLSCAGCGQQVLREHAVEFKGKRYCAPCLQSIERPKAGQSLR